MSQVDKLNTEVMKAGGRQVEHDAMAERKREYQKMTVTEFAERYRLRTKRDREDGTLVIAGKAGQIYEYEPCLLAVMYVLPTRGEPRPRKWKNILRKCLIAGMIVLQDGDAEGSLSFDPGNWDQARLAIQIAGVKRKRKLSDEHRSKLVASGVQFKARNASLQAASGR